MKETRNQSLSTMIRHLVAIHGRAKDNDFTTLAEDRALAKTIQYLRDALRAAKNAPAEV